MKVILTQDVKNLGKKGTMAEVKDGYARNFLLPRGLAVEASPDNINVMKTRAEAEKTRKDRELAKAKELASMLQDKVVTIKAKAGENGKLFGAITAKNISDAIKETLKVEVDKKDVQLDEAIKTLGTTEVDIKLYSGVSAKISVKIVEE